MKGILSLATVLALLLSSCASTTSEDAKGGGEIIPNAVSDPRDDTYLVPGNPPIHPPLLAPSS